MTISELLVILVTLSEHGDIEERHQWADKALLEYIDNDIVTAVFEAMYKYYV